MGPSHELPQLCESFSPDVLSVCKAAAKAAPFFIKAVRQARHDFQILDIPLAACKADGLWRTAVAADLYGLQERPGRCCLSYKETQPKFAIDS